MLLMISAQEIMDWTNQSLATMGSNLPSVNLKADKKLKLKWLFLV
jgi:hypothetical protein